MKRLILIPFFLLSLLATGTNYYVKNTGNDSNTGLSDSQAWAHHPWMSTWTGSVILKPGDIINMKRGDIWTIAYPDVPFMTVEQSGNKGSPITTTAYSTGASPIIRISTATDQAVIIARGKSYLNFDNLHIQHHSKIYAPNRFGVLLVNVCHHVTFTNNEIDKIPYAAIQAGSDSYYITVGDTSASKVATSTAYSNHIHDFGYGGVILLGVNPASGESNFKVYYNYIHDGIRTSGENIYGVVFDANPASTAWPKYAIARYNRVENISWNGLDTHGGSYIYFLDNYIKNFGTLGLLLGGRPEVGSLPPTCNHFYAERNIFEQTPTEWVTGNEYAFITSFISPSSETDKVSDVCIKDNIMFYTSRPANGYFTGVRIHNSRNLIASGNKIFNGSTSRGSPAFQIDGDNGNEDITITNNYISQWGSGVNIVGSAITGNLAIKKNIIVKPVGDACLTINNSNISSTAVVRIYNNTFVEDSYSACIYSDYGIISGGSVIAKNNILGSETPLEMQYWHWGGVLSGTFICDNNLYWNSSAESPFYIGGSTRDWTYWTATLGSDTHGIGPNTDPLFRNSTGSYSQDIDFELQSTSPSINKGTDLGLSTDYADDSISGLPDIGAFENQPAIIPSPTFTGSVIENAAPTVIELTYNLTLANIVPPVSAFTVMVNSSARSVNSVAISGTKVLLTLSSPVAYGDVVTVAYTKPSTNPIQTTAGGQAGTISTQTVANKVAAAPPPIPVYLSSAIENATPSKLEIIYSLSLDNIVPAVSAFIVMVNSTARTVSSISISGTKIILTLSSPVAAGNVITVAYTKPSANPIQTTAGGQATTISAQTVTNKVVAAPPPIPVYLSSAIENTTPSKLEMIYSLSFASIVPAVSAFTVLVNSTARTVSSVSISGTKVILTLSSPVEAGNAVTVAYSKPSANPLQTNAGGQASTIAAQPVTNKVEIINSPPVVVVNSSKNNLSGFVGELDATGSYDPNNDNLSYTWVVPINISVSSTTGSKIQFLSPIVNSSQKFDFTLHISDGKTTQSKVITVEILPYKPELEVAEVLNVEASGFQSPNYPHNILDGNIGTMWAVNGDNQWLSLELKELFNIQHVRLSFKYGQRNESYFDILGSDDNVTWIPILTKSASCSFSGDLQVFEFPPSKSLRELKFVKLVGQSNSLDSWNYISEFRIFGYKYRNPLSYEEQPVKIFPNPTLDYVNIRIDKPSLAPDLLKIISLAGKIVYQVKINPDIREFKIPINFTEGIYLVQLQSNNLILFTQKLIVQ